MNDVHVSFLYDDQGLRTQTIPPSLTPGLAQRFFRKRETLTFSLIFMVRAHHRWVSNTETVKLPKPISLRRTYRVSKQKQLITVLFRSAMRVLKITDRDVMRRVYDKRQELWV